MEESCGGCVAESQAEAQVDADIAVTQQVNFAEAHNLGEELVAEAGAKQVAEHAANIMQQVSFLVGEVGAKLAADHSAVGAQGRGEDWGAAWRRIAVIDQMAKQMYSS